MNRWFARFARRERLSSEQLCQAMDRAARGLIDADLGGGVIKQRVARPGRGKSGGYRVIVVWRSADRAFFIRGFAKNERDNLEVDEFYAIRDVARDLLALTQNQLNRLVATNEFAEIDCDAQTLQE